MAVQALTNTAVGQSSRLVTWTALANGDTGQPFHYPDYGGDATVTFEGTFGTGGTIKLRGSNDGTNYYDLTDPQGAAISKTAAGVKLVTEAPQYIRPEVTAGDGTTALQCRLFIRKVR